MEATPWIGQPKSARHRGVKRLFARHRGATGFTHFRRSMMNTPSASTFAAIVQVRGFSAKYFTCPLEACCHALLFDAVIVRRLQIMPAVTFRKLLDMLPASASVFDVNDRQAAA